MGVRVSISRGFVQPLLHWDVLERVLFDDPDLTQEFVTRLREQVPAVTQLNAKLLDELGATERQRQRTLLVLKDARDELHRTQQSPLVTLMGRTRGWVHGTRAKLYLTLLWKHQQDQLSVAPVMVDELVALVGVDRRSVNQGLRALHDLRFIELLEFRDRQPKDGHDQKILVRGHDVELLSGLGTGEPYQRPHPGEFFQVGDELWTEKWIARMPGQGLAVLLVLLSRLDSRDPTGPIWVASSQVREWYGFSDRVWQHGVRYLRNAKLVTMHRHGTYKHDDNPDRTRRKFSAPQEPDPTNASVDRRKFYAPDGIAHPWLVPETSDGTRDTDGSPPDGAHVLYLKQNRTLAIPFREAVKRLRAEYQLTDDPIERYELAREMVLFAAEQPTEGGKEAETVLRSWSRIQINLADAYSTHLKKEQKKHKLPAHEGYRHLVDLLAQDRNYEQALELAQEAKDHGWGRTRPDPDSWSTTIQRLDRTARRAVTYDSLSKLSDAELYDPAGMTRTDH